MISRWYLSSTLDRWRPKKTYNESQQTFLLRSESPNLGRIASSDGLVVKDIGASAGEGLSDFRSACCSSRSVPWVKVCELAQAGR